MEAPPPGLRKHTWVLVKQPGYKWGLTSPAPSGEHSYFISGNLLQHNTAGQLARIGVANLDITATLATNTL